MGAARMVGDTSLYKKMEQAEQDIKRDIVFAASLVSFKEKRAANYKLITLQIVFLKLNTTILLSLYLNKLKR